MTDALNSLLAPFKRQLADLEQKQAAGTLTPAQHASERTQIERRLLDMLLHEAPVPVAQAPAKPSWTLLLALAALVVAIAAGGYAYNRSANPPQADEAGAEGGASSAQIVAMVDQLAERMKQNPGDADGWAMLARSYSVMERNDEALDAYKKAVALRKDDAGLLVDYADALAVKNQHSLRGEPMALITRALQLEPKHIKALALAGTDAYVRQDFVGAVKYWSQVVQVGPPDNVLVQRVAASLQEARSRAGLPPEAAPLAAAPAAAAPANPQTMPSAGEGPSVSGTVSLSRDLQAQVSPQDTVFIFAKAAGNGRMPLAAERKQVKDLPYTFTLDDSKSMSPQARLSSATQVVISARISKTGNAIAQAGDLQGQSSAVALGTKDLKIEIKDSVKP